MSDANDRPPAAAPRVGYGVDAPGVVRNLALGGLGALAAAALLYRLAGRSRPVVARLSLGWGTLNGLGCLASAGLMLWSSKVGKARELDRLLDTIPWRGDEAVLDVGPGRGALLVRAARRLITGHAIGADLWREQDQSGNRPEATRSNARAEGVGDCVALVSGDARHLPFAGGVFDVVVSSLTLHNIADTAERAGAVREIARVLKPGGRVALLDFQHTEEYERILGNCGLREALRSQRSFGMYPPVRVVTARQPS
jgi:arsenite methyltransferase